MVCVTAVLGVAAVIALDQYYHMNGVFPLGVFINQLYCTGMTVEEVSSALNASYDLSADSIAVCTLDGELHELPLDEYGVTVSYEPAVLQLLEQYENNSFLWLRDILGFSPQHGQTPLQWLGQMTGFSKSCAWMHPEEGYFNYRRIYPTYYCDTSVMAAKLETAWWLNENLYNAANTVSVIRSTQDGYILVDETQDLLLKDAAVELICANTVKQLTSDPPFRGTVIDLSAGSNREICYRSIPHTDEMKATLEKWEGIRAFQDFEMIYQFGDREEIVDADVVADWMALDGEGNIVFDENSVPVLDESMIAEYVAYLSASYNTVGIEREFHATRGDIVKVSGGGYGNEIDERAEYEFLLNAFRSRQSGTRVPEYTTEAWEKGADDIGDTYIEVDMGSQHMYYYVDGEAVIDTPIVTGNMARRWGTPSKVCYVYFKQKNRVLRGANYATPVKYWMAVDGHIGVHDATWRREFGGEIYKTDGSHGCINTPLEIMTELYDMVELGTPVIMFY